MRFRQLSGLVGLLLLGALSHAQTQPPPARRDAQAVDALQRAVAAMGGVAPNDSSASGTVTITAGGKTDQGTVRILTRGTGQSSEEYQAGDVSFAEVFADGVGAVKKGSQFDTKEDMSMEWACSAQTGTFPAALLVAWLNDPETAFEYVGLEKLESGEAHHIKVWKTFASRPKMAHLAEFSVKEVWISATTNLPLKLAYERRNGGGAEPRIPMAVIYSDYRNVGGILYPHLIEKHYNGTPWATIRITSVSLNTGLTDAAFRLN